jgi:UDP-N-acetylmuramoylalanine--D-glutamate ligase
MITFSQAKGKTIGVLGLGLTGTSLVKACATANKIFIWERDPSKFTELKSNFTGSAQLKLVDSNQNDKDNLATIIKHLDYLAVSPGIPLHGEQAHPVYQAAVKHKIPIISDLEILMEENPSSKFVAITGTNGKSTTTALASHILTRAGIPHQMGGNIGQPVLELENNVDIYLLEVSSFQLDLMQKPRFNCSALLNITPDHLDRHLTMQAYCDAKAKAFDNQSAGDLAIISLDDEYSRSIYQKLQNSGMNAQQNSISCKNGNADIWCEGRTIYFGAQSMELPEIPSLMGTHNMQNIMAVFAIANYLGVDMKQFTQYLGDFIGLPHRMELVAQQQELIIINDSKGTNTDATAKALATFDDIYLIAGGISKDNGMIDLQEYFSKLKMVYLIGKAAESFAETLYRYHVPHIIAGDMATALKYFREAKVSSGTLLLSPACASFDQFSSYKERGETFKQLVHSLILKK